MQRVLLQFLKPMWRLTTDALFWPPWAPGTSVIHRHAFKQNTHAHKINKYINRPLKLKVTALVTLLVAVSKHLAKAT